MSNFVTKPIPDDKPDVSRVTRPWGSFSQYAFNEDTTVSLMTVLPGQRLSLQSHTGRAARMDTAWLDDAGRLYLGTDLGLGLVHTLDMETAADAVERGWWVPQAIGHAALLQRFGVCLSPQHLE